jgi:putative intracellular protease/amidase
MKVLMVLTSHDQLGNTGRKTGFWLEELAAPYYVFKDAGAQITLASPKGGRPPLDPKSNEPNFQTDITRRFEKDAEAEAQLGATVRLDSVNRKTTIPSSTPVAMGRCGISPKTRTRSS